MSQWQQQNPYAAQAAQAQAQAAYAYQQQQQQQFQAQQQAQQQHAYAAAAMQQQQFAGGSGGSAANNYAYASQQYGQQMPTFRSGGMYDASPYDAGYGFDAKSAGGFEYDDYSTGSSARAGGRHLPSALKTWNHKVKWYSEHYDVSLKDAMIALKGTGSKGSKSKSKSKSGSGRRHGGCDSDDED
jgi:hypothetical protein